MELTLEKLNEIACNHDIWYAIQIAQKQYGEYPQRLNKPTLGFNATSKEAIEYANRLIEYENGIEDYKLKKKSYYENKNKIDDLITEFIKDSAGIHIVPEQYRDKLYSKAWEDGHSDGFYSVYQKLCSLVEIFE